MTHLCLGAAAAVAVLSCQPQSEEGPGPGVMTGGAGGTTATGGRGGSSSQGASGGTTGGVGGATSEGSGGAGGAASTGGQAGGGAPMAGSGGSSAADALVEPDTAQTADATASDGAPAGAGSPGCGTRNPAGTFMVTAGAATTPYRVVLPMTYDPAKPYPLVIYLHGRGNNIEGQGNIARDVAGANLGIVANLKSYGSSGWESPPNNDKPVENLALIRALIKHLGTQYCIDTRKVVMSGFSSGCWFGSRLACQMKGELAGVVIAGCGLDPMGRCPDQVPMTYIIGRGDGQFGNSAAAAEFYRTRNGCMMPRAASPPSPCESYAGCTDGFATNYCVHPGGHMWPGFGGQAIVEMLKRLP
jgi:polyhydroxybutyrate depolymerase